MGESPTYALLLAGSGELDVLAATRVLAPALGLHTTEAARLVVSSHGVPATELDGVRAQQILMALAAQGVPAALVPTSELVAVPQPHEFCSLNWADAEHLVSANREGEVRRLLWADIVALCVARVEPPVSRHGSLDQVLPTTPLARLMTKSIRAWAESESVPNRPGLSREPETLLSLVSRDAHDHVEHWRAAAERMSYACLGDRASPHAATNFHAVVTALHARLGGAGTNLTERMIAQPNLFPWPVVDHPSRLDRLLFRLVNLPRPERESRSVR